MRTRTSAGSSSRASAGPRGSSREEAGTGFGRRAAAAVLASLIAFPAPAQDAPKPADARPVTLAAGELGDLLRKWYAEGTAAGNTGDLYDNRDRGHSALGMGPYPQLGKVVYTEEERQKRLDWAFCAAVRPAVVFGNSSTSAGAWEGGSNPRRAYAHPRGLAVLLLQYTRNNLYIYPEHRDHDPGHNGIPEGFGDLFPTNTPFVIISQGSSGSDQPFMKALPFTLAAFRPEVKKKLIETGLLMPAVQMILRWCSKRLKDPEKEYLTGKAHPTVFEGSWVDPLRMVRMAHEIVPETIPPVAALKVLEEDAPLDGRDFFEPGATEKHFDSPLVVARIFRGKQRVRRIVVSAEPSRDVNGRPLSFHWSVLRGDAERIRITKKNGAGSVVEILVPHHGRRPVEPGSPLESNRVDIGAFVHNGAFYSPPGFVTFFFLDHEARTYDETGRLLEIGYQAGETTLSVRDWPRLFALLEEGDGSWPARFLRKRFKAEELAGLREAAREYPALAGAAKAAEEKKKTAGKEARKALEDANKALKDFLAGRPALVERALREMAGDPGFFFRHQVEIESFLRTDGAKGRRGALEGARARLERLGILEGKPSALRLLRPGKPTEFERAMLKRFHGEVLSGAIFPGILESRFWANYVQPEISEPPYWRDVYHYDPEGNETGWTRYGDESPREFTAEGLLVLQKDGRGRPTKARTMTYEAEKAKGAPGKGRRWPFWRKTLQIPGDEIRHYEYEGDEDRKGRVVRTEKAVDAAAPPETRP